MSYDFSQWLTASVLCLLSLSHDNVLIIINLQVTPINQLNKVWTKFEDRVVCTGSVYWSTEGVFDNCYSQGRSNLPVDKLFEVVGGGGGYESKLMGYHIEGGGLWVKTTGLSYRSKSRPAEYL